MTEVNTIKDAEAFFLLHSPKRMRGNYTLDRMHELMSRLGNPQNNLKIVHIAGTSGKTSTAYFIRGMLEAAGQKTGLTVSPHIEDIAERAQIGGKPLVESTYVSYVNEFKQLVEAMSDVSPTYFELVIAFAFWVFEKEKVDYAVVETGLGGLLDATNVADRSDKLCVITPIGYDHTEILGDALEQIARQKAGIVRPENDVVISIRNKRLISCFMTGVIHWQDASRIPELPIYQHENWQLAQTTFEILSRRDDLPRLSSSDYSSVAKQTPPGRYEVINTHGKIVILDGAHNPQKLTAFIASLPDEYIASSRFLIGLSDAPDTKIEQCVSILTDLQRPLLCTEFAVGQDIKYRSSVSAATLATLCRDKGADANPKRDTGLALQQLLLSDEPVAIITGSLYLVSVAREQLRNLGNSSSQ